MAEDNLVLAQVEKIVLSEEFRAADTSRRLLRFLVDKSLAGHGESLKEYTIAIECLGKPSTYDPRQSATVRIQVGRLRQKLSNYYQVEGAGDDLIIEIPKGRFDVVVLNHNAQASIPIIASPELPASSQDGIKSISRGGLPYPYVALLSLLLLGCIGILIYREDQHSKHFAMESSWTSDLQALWEPFLTSSQPVMITVGNPLFVEYNTPKQQTYVHIQGENDWETVRHYKSIEGIDKVLAQPGAEPSRYFTAYGEAVASFILARRVGPMFPKFTLLRISDLPWSQFAANNTIFVGVENLFFAKQILSTDVKPDFVQTSDGIEDLKATGSTPSLYRDDYRHAPTESGLVYALVTHVPGPQGRTDVLSFSSSRSAGYVAGVQAFTNPVMAKNVVTALNKANGGRMPRYYQLLFRVRFENEVPTETVCIQTRELK